MAARRVVDEPVYMLHHYDWSESSLILEAFSRHHGRVALVAKGAKRPTSSLRPVLLPLQRLRVTWGGDAEVKTLKGAEWHAGHALPTGAALLAGFYLNELLLALLAREDAHPRLFDVYSAVVHVLATATPDVAEAALRTFELLLLQEVGLLPALDRQTASLQALDAQTAYMLRPEAGLSVADAVEHHALSGAQWLRLQAGLTDADPFTATLRGCAELTPGLKPQLRAVLLYHCGRPALRTRQLMLDLQRL